MGRVSWNEGGAATCFVGAGSATAGASVGFVSARLAPTGWASADFESDACAGVTAVAGSVLVAASVADGVDCCSVGTTAAVVSGAGASGAVVTAAGASISLEPA